MNTRHAIIHFLDGTTLGLEWPRQTPKDFLKFRDAVTNAMESSHLSLEVEGNLMVIKTSSVKYFELIPAPEELPPGVVRSARRVDATTLIHKEAA